MKKFNGFHHIRLTIFTYFVDKSLIMTQMDLDCFDFQQVKKPRPLDAALTANPHRRPDPAPKRAGVRDVPHGDI